jgi:hypothetical protein
MRSTKCRVGRLSKGVYDTKPDQMMILLPKAERNLQHYRTIQALSLILGPERKNDAEYL